jgi:hypothetical protein
MSVILPLRSKGNIKVKFAWRGPWWASSNHQTYRVRCSDSSDQFPGSRHRRRRFLQFPGSRTFVSSLATGKTTSLSPRPRPSRLYLTTVLAGIGFDESSPTLPSPTLLELSSASYSSGSKKNGSGSQSPEFPPRSSHIIRQIRSDSPRSITCIGVEDSKAGFGLSSHGPI